MMAGVRSRWPGEMASWIPAVAYLVLGGAWAWNYRFHLSSDAVVYLDIARVMVEGRVPEMFVGYWGPVLPAKVAVLLALGVPAVLAGKLLGFLSGLLFVLTMQVVLRTRLSPRRAAAATTLVAVPATIYVGVPFSILPDAMLGCVAAVDLLLLLSYARNPTALKALGAGLLCGLAYLCKSPAWILFLPSTAAVLAWTTWTRRRRDGGLRAGRWSGHGALAVLGLVVIMIPWMAGLRAHSGRWSTGSSSDFLLAHNLTRDGYATLRSTRWMEIGGERWLHHNPWTMEMIDPVPFVPRYHADRLARNVWMLLPFAVCVPWLVIAVVSLVSRARRSLRTPRRATLLFFVLPMIALLARGLEHRWLLYYLPALALLGVRSPLPRWMGPLARRRDWIPAAFAAASCLVLARHAPITPLGTARWREATSLASTVRPGDHVWCNRTASGLPISYLLGLDITGPPLRKPGRRWYPDPDFVVWSRTPGDRRTDWPAEATLPGFRQERAWTEEDGLEVRVYRYEGPKRRPGPVGAPADDGGGGEEDTQVDDGE